MNEILKKSLSLGESGGIYFGGERVDGDPKQIIMFVGIGGTGTDALIRIKNQVYNRMKLPVDIHTGLPVSDAPKNIAFLALDTDQAVEDKVFGNTKFRKDGSEFVHIGTDTEAGVTLPRLVTQFNEFKNDKMDYAEWFPEGISADGGTAGANGKRPVGRVGFFNRVDEIRSRLTGTLNELNINNPNATSLTIFVFTGVAGGTGSGNFIDVGYTLRELGARCRAACTVLGYIFLPDLNERDGGRVDVLRSNAFAALKELDYMMENGKKDFHFIQKYNASGTSVNGSIPFDYCHLINATDVKGKLYTKEDIMKSVVENVFVYIANESATTMSMSSLYDNINTYLDSVSAKAPYPASYDHLSVGASSVQIPYMEITTLLACRMFERLKKTFNKQVTSQSFAEDLMALGLGGANSQQMQNALAQVLEEKQPPTLELTIKEYPWEKIWGTGKNFAYSYAYGNAQTYQNNMMECYAGAVGHYEGLLRRYLKNKIQTYDRGPVYLANMISSNSNPNIIQLLHVATDYYNKIAQQQISKRTEIENELSELDVKGRNAGFGSKKNAAKEYLVKLNEWLKNEKLVDKYGYLSDLTDALEKRFQKYYEDIMKPLKDTLEELLIIFDENLNNLDTEWQRARKAPDPSILLYPFQFEHKYRDDFNECVENAEQNFLANLGNNLHYWIGRDIDEVDRNTSEGVDVGGFLARFISDCFSPLYNTINMETIMDAQKAPGQTLQDYAQDVIAKIYNRSNPLFKKNGIVIPTEDFSILSIPSGCPNIAIAANNFKSAIGATKLIIKISSEKNRIYVAKVTAGLPLYANAYLNDWEDAYEAAIPEREKYLHLIYGWKDALPSPNIEQAWTNVAVNHNCERTARVNRKMREAFKRCYDAELILYKEGDGKAQLILPDSEVDIQNVKLQGTLAQKHKRLEKLESRVWKKDSLDKKCMQLESKSRYLLGGSGKDGMDAMLTNIRENILRDPKVWEALKNECKTLDVINGYKKSLTFPRYFGLALICNMFEFNGITHDIYLKREEMDPSPELLIDYAVNPYNQSSPEFFYMVYEKLYAILEEKARDDATWIEIITKNWQVQLRKNENPRELQRVKKVCETFGARFQSYGRKLTDEVNMQVDPKQAREIQKLVDFYSGCFEELAVIYKTLG